MKIDTYVVNLDARKDRCACMASQLASAPQAVHRQAAVGREECSLGYDQRTLYGTRDHAREESLFCTNYKIWNRALASDAEFILILEDDVILQPGFWQSIHEFAKSCPSFDYVTVDSWKDGGIVESDRDDTCAKSGFTELFRPHQDQTYWGTHVQLIRKNFLPTLIQRAQTWGMGPLDVWWMMRANDGRSFSWQPRIGLQFDRAPALDLKNCSNSVGHSDINPKAFVQEPKLECPP
jgi:GR25 family glycosyltransferase involved in LPS biosynthesis